MSFVSGMAIGAVMAAAVTAPVTLFGRDRALDLLAIQLAAIGAIYAGFALVDVRLSVQVTEIVGALVFFAVSAVGLWFSPLVLALAYLAHGAWDTVHHLGAVSTAIPRWYPSFCLGYDWLVAAYIWNRFSRDD
jgi:hypothetical protein